MKQIKDTVFLPKAKFPLRQNPALEPGLIVQWEDQNIYEVRNEGKTEQFVLHDGPPYANGNIHIGHAMNKIHKDIIVRGQAMMGKQASFIPGWDCHGLPIEWKVEEQYRAQGKNKNDVSVVEFRKECRDYAAKWIDVQLKEFQRLGICADWKKPYITMDYETEAWIASEARGFSLAGSLYRAFRPVPWSPVEQTSLAEAEIEYEDRKITTAYVRFPIKNTKNANYANVSLIAWTTTPWTIPCNRALAVSKDIEYIRVRATEGKFKDKHFIIAEESYADFFASTGMSMDVLYKLNFTEEDGIICYHPLHHLGFDEDVPVLFGDFVTANTGTGIVHLAPSHGLDDFNLCKKHGIELTDNVMKNGTYKLDLPIFAGIHVYKATEPVLKALDEQETLIETKPMVHSTALSWRSKAPLIYLATPQWFISMDHKDSTGKTIRERCLDALNDVNFIPASSRNRLEAMVQSRPDWCISRQRTWGVPLTLFVHKQTGEVLHDCDVDGAIDAYIRKYGSDVWFEKPANYFLNAYEGAEDAYNPDDYEMVTDVLDVWFESGASYAYVIEGRKLPVADVYLEGSDQHRGWFQASLIQSASFEHADHHRRGKAPFKTLITDGFVLDKNGRKMAKSEGNVVAPEKIINEYGADVLRLWVANADTTEDVRVGDPIIKQQNEIYRKLRNTLRYLVGVLSETKMTTVMPDVHTAYKADPARVYLEQYVLLKVGLINNMVKAAVDNHDWKQVMVEIHNFCAGDLSLYFDARKDVVYCGQGDHTPDRNITLNMMAFLFHTLTRWLAPVLPFAAEEAWQEIFGADSSVHLCTFDIQEIDLDMDDTERLIAFPEFWQNVKSVRSSILKDMEELREKKQIGSPLDVAVTLDHSLYFKLNARWVFKDWENFLGVSMVNGNDFNALKLFDVMKIIGREKCERCWKKGQTYGRAHNVCLRCERVMG